MITSNTETTKHLTLPNTFCFAVLAALALVMSGCRSQQATVKAADPAGVYALVSVDGKQVPVNTSHEGTILQVRSGTFTINADGTCSTKTIFVPPSGAEVTREVNATYTKDGSKLNMQWKGAGKTAGTILDDTFTMNNEGMIFVYRK